MSIYFSVDHSDFPRPINGQVVGIEFGAAKAKDNTLEPVMVITGVNGLSVVVTMNDETITYIQEALVAVKKIMSGEEKVPDNPRTILLGARKGAIH